MINPHWSNIRRLSLVVLILGASLSIGLQLWYGPKSVSIPSELQGILLPEARSLRSFHLTDHNGETFDLARLYGHWTFMFFGYTHCPDVCPTTMGLLSAVFERLEATSSPTEVAAMGVFVSVDPKRDTLAVLKEYVPYFNKNFIGATGDETALNELAKQVGARFIKGKDQGNASGYEVSHSSAIFLIDPKGQFAGVFYPNLFSPDDIVQRFRIIKDLFS